MRFHGSLLALVPLLVSPSDLQQAGAQEIGAVEFVAQVTPSDGRPEPVRNVTFYLLRKSFAEIQKEAEQAEPKPDLDAFIAGLEVSQELKAWMKRNRAVELTGQDFMRQLKADDVLAVPEFYDAYVKQNTGGALGFPTPKHRAEDATRNPQKYQRQLEEYRRRIRRYLDTNPHSVEGIEAELDALNPGPHWLQQQAEQRVRARRRALQLANLQYLAAKADTGLDGRGVFVGIPAGEYWLTTLETEAVAGDVRLRWDNRVTVYPGTAVRVELSNLNALEPPRSAP